MKKRQKEEEYVLYRFTYKMSELDVYDGLPQRNENHAYARAVTDIEFISI